MEKSEMYFEYAYSKYSTMLYRIAVLTARRKSDAEDCVSETFLRLFKRGGKFSGEEHEKAWLIRVCVNTCKNKNKEYWNRNTCALEDYKGFFSEDNSKLELSDLMTKLKPKENIALYLKYYEELSSEQIGKVLSMSAEGVRTLLHRARQSLKLHIESEE